MSTEYGWEGKEYVNIVMLPQGQQSFSARFMWKCNDRVEKQYEPFLRAAAEGLNWHIASLSVRTTQIAQSVFPFRTRSAPQYPELLLNCSITGAVNESVPYPTHLTPPQSAQHTCHGCMLIQRQRNTECVNATLKP